MNQATYITVTIDAATAAASADIHCHHDDGSMTSRLVMSRGAVVYVNANSPDELERLADSLCSIARSWRGDDDDGDINDACDRCGITTPSGAGHYPDGLAGERLCRVCHEEGASHG